MFENSLRNRNLRLQADIAGKDSEIAALRVELEKERAKRPNANARAAIRFVADLYERRANELAVDVGADVGRSGELYRIAQDLHRQGKGEAVTFKVVDRILKESYLDAMKHQLLFGTPLDPPRPLEPKITPVTESIGFSGEPRVREAPHAIIRKDLRPYLRKAAR